MRSGVVGLLAVGLCGVALGLGVPAARIAAALIRISADLYFLLRTFAKRIGRTDLSLLVADRGVLAAEVADDPIRRAAAKWNLGHILLAQGEADGAEEVAVRAIEDLQRDTSDESADAVGMTGLCGWCLLSLPCATTTRGRRVTGSATRRCLPRGRPGTRT